MLHGRRSLRLSKSERAAMRTACRFNAEVMDFVRPHVREGVTTQQIDELVHDYTLQHGHVPAPLNYQGFPKAFYQIRSYQRLAETIELDSIGKLSKGERETNKQF